MSSGCIFCGRSELRSQDLFICSACFSRLAGCGRETLEKAVMGHDLTEEQLHFLGVSKFSKTTLPKAPIIKNKKRGK